MLCSVEQRALESVPAVLAEFRALDTAEERDTQTFSEEGCSCVYGPGGRPCCQHFSRQQYLDFRAQCAELSHAEMDMVLMGQVMALSESRDLTRHSLTHRKNENRQRGYMFFYHQGLRVCRKTFLFLHGISDWRLRAVQTSCRRDGLRARVHGNTKRLPPNALAFSDIQRVISYISNFAEVHAILLPGRIPGYSRADLQLLPTSTTRWHVWKSYTDATTTTSTSPDDDMPLRCVAYPTFCRLWRKLLPQILPTRPMTDLCAVCHQNSTLIMRGANLPEVEKTQVISPKVLESSKN